MNALTVIAFIISGLTLAVLIVEASSSIYRLFYRVRTLSEDHVPKYKVASLNDRFDMLIDRVNCLEVTVKKNSKK
jgi:phosphoglycerate-specific signal transduction histidine kinase